ncbi:MAG: hypothetical protein HW415_1620, partial [Deltaproteobacteria bacterium]|nr:hypothetical protein [Deltaproteobacteria bacterium]
MKVKFLSLFLVIIMSSGVWYGCPTKSSDS